MRRAKFVLDGQLVHRALGLGKGLRVVMLHVTRDPDRLHVTVEGPDVPALSGRVGDEAVLAWQGLVDAPVLQWPEPAGPPAAERAAEPVTVNACRVDESVGEADVGRPQVDPGAAAVGRAWESAVEAVRSGVPAATVLNAVEDAVVEGLRVGQREVRHEVLTVLDRLRSLLAEQAVVEKVTDSR